MINKLVNSINKNKNMGFFNGYARDLIILINLYDFYKDDYYLELINNVINKALTDNETVGLQNMGLWNGPLSFSLSCDLLYLYFKNEEYYTLNKMVYKKVYPIIEYWLNIDDVNLEYNYDYVYGFSGVLMYIAQHSIAKSSRIILKKLEKKVSKILNNNFLDKLIKTKETDIFLRENIYSGMTEFVILGLAHGATGFAIGLNSIKEIISANLKYKIDEFNDKFESIFKEIINNNSIKGLIPLKAYYIRDKNKFVTIKSEYLNDYSWCYGICGLGIYINKYLDNKILQSHINSEINKIVDKILITNKENALSLCHGYSAIFYFWFMYLFNSDKYDEICDYINKLVNGKDNILEYSDLLIGNDGIILTFLSFNSRKRFVGDIIFGY